MIPEYALMKIYAVMARHRNYPVVLTVSSLPPSRICSFFRDNIFSNCSEIFNFFFKNIFCINYIFGQ